MDPFEDQEGNVVFIRIDNIDEEKIFAFDKVKDEVEMDIINQLQKNELEKLSEQYLNDINNNINSLEQIADKLDIAILTRDKLNRYSFDEVFSRLAIEEIFKTSINKPFKANVGIGDSIIIGLIKEISTREQNEESIISITQQNEENLRNELLFILAEELQKELQTAERYGDQLRATLQKHNLTHLANKKPGMIEKRMQNATNRLWDCLADVTDPNGVFVDAGTESGNCNKNSKKPSSNSSKTKASPTK